MKGQGESSAAFSSVTCSALSQGPFSDALCQDNSVVCCVDLAILGAQSGMDRAKTCRPVRPCDKLTSTLKSD